MMSIIEMMRSVHIMSITDMMSMIGMSVQRGVEKGCRASWRCLVQCQRIVV